jgi:hypothetical protein
VFSRSLATFGKLAVEQVNMPAILQNTYPIFSGTLLIELKILQALIYGSKNPICPICILH